MSQPALAGGSARARARGGSFSTPSRAFLPLLLLATVLWLGQTRTLGQSEASDTRPHVSGIDALEMEANALAETITNQLRAASKSAAEREQAANSHLVLNLVLGMGAIVLLMKLGGKFLESRGERDPWNAHSTTQADLAAEEKSFAEFAATFTCGPSGKGPEQPAVACAAESAAAPSPPKDTPASPQQTREHFLQQTAKRLASVRKLFSEIGRVPGEAAQSGVLKQLSEEIGALCREADSPATRPVWQMAAALDGLVRQLVGRVNNVTPSTLRTLASAIDLLHGLRLRGLDPNLATTPPVRLLVVDDDAVSRHAMAFSLKKVFTPPDVAADGEAALVLAEANAYDVVFLDIQMPGMDGFEVCSRIHGTLHNATTPVVFVTCRTDFDARARSAVSGGQDLIAKPFLTFELAVKALTLVLRRRIEARAHPPRPVPPPAPTPAAEKKPEAAKTLEPATAAA